MNVVVFISVVVSENSSLYASPVAEKVQKAKFPELNIKQASGEKVIKPFLAGLHQVLNDNTEIIK